MEAVTQNRGCLKTFKQRLVSKLGCTELFFVEPGVKVLSDVASDLGMSSDFFIFQQDSAPAHRAKGTIALLRCETLSFIGPELWPANSPDLNPVDYRIWGLIQEHVYSTRQQYGTSTS